MEGTNYSSHADHSMVDYDRRYTCLMYSCTRGHTDIVKHLIDFGDNVQFRDRSSPSNSAAPIEKIDIVKYLIEAGSEIHLIDIDEDPPSI